jgi:hypothetical protein
MSYDVRSYANGSNFDRNMFPFNIATDLRDIWLTHYQTCDYVLEYLTLLPCNTTLMLDLSSDFSRSNCKYARNAYWQTGPRSAHSFMTAFNTSYHYTFITPYHYLSSPLIIIHYYIFHHFLLLLWYVLNDIYQYKVIRISAPAEGYPYKIKDLFTEVP